MGGGAGPPGGSAGAGNNPRKELEEASRSLTQQAGALAKAEESQLMMTPEA